MRLPASIKAFGITRALDYLERDPDANLPRLMEWVDKYTEERLSPAYRELFHKAMTDPENNWHRLIKSMYTDIDNRVLKKIFENFDERPKSLLYAIAMDAYPLGFSGATGESLEQQVHLAIFKTIRHIAEEGPCVIIGRCADYALADNPNLLSLFISAPLEDRIARVAKRQKVTPEEAKSLIQKTDKRRASYCEYYASKKWGAVDAYDFCLNSSALGLGGTVELIQAMVAHKEHPIPSPTEEDPTRPRT